jgi:hypothetical protein
MNQMTICLVAGCGKIQCMTDVNSISIVPSDCGGDNMLDKIEEMIENVKVSNVKLGKFLKVRNWEITGIKTAEGKDIYFCKQTGEFIVEEDTE